jgi:DNA-binding CsgD family transcriptional regulator
LAFFAVAQPGSLTAAALLFASDSAESPPTDTALLRAQFGFTWAEARAVAALTDGIDTPSIAARLGVSVETIRSQVKSAQAKCGAGSQAGLALMAQRSLAVLRRDFT